MGLRAGLGRTGTWGREENMDGLFLLSCPPRSTTAMRFCIHRPELFLRAPLSFGSPWVSALSPHYFRLLVAGHGNYHHCPQWWHETLRTLVVCLDPMQFLWPCSWFSIRQIHAHSPPSHLQSTVNAYRHHMCKPPFLWPGQGINRRPR